MTERPDPDLDRVREALRRHDERTADDREEPESESEDDEDERENDE